MDLVTKIFLIILVSLIVICFIVWLFANYSMSKWLEVEFLLKHNLVDYEYLITTEDVFDYNRYKKSGLPALSNKLYKAFKYLEKESKKVKEKEVK